MNTLVGIALFGLLFWKLKNNFINRTTLSCNFQLQELGYKLDMLVVSNTLKSENPKYRNLRGNILNAERTLEYMNLGSFLMYFIRNRKKQSNRPTKSTFKNNTISKKEHRSAIEIAKIEKEFNEIIFQYIIKKNVAVKVIYFANFFWIAPIKRLLSSSIEGLRGSVRYYLDKSISRGLRYSSMNLQYS